MTPAEFKEKFPNRKEDINHNCLEDIACQKCGSRGPFRIVVMGFALIEDDGVDGTEDTDWNEQSPCVCKECQHEGTVIDFIVVDLDEALAELEDV